MTPQTMTMKDGLLAEFDYEMATLRKHLEQVPDDKLSWSPHAKSMTLGRLASHLAEIPSWAVSMTEQSEFDIAPPDGSFDYVPADLGSRSEILNLFDTQTAEARGLIDAKNDAELMEPWSFKKGGQVMMTYPKMVAIRNHIIKHAVHHRGQITVYLRQVGVSVPQTYGPTADYPDM